MTLHVPNHLEQRLKAISAAEGKTEQEMLEEILLQALMHKTKKQKVRQSWVGIAESGIGDLSERVDELLFAEGLGRRS
jgi:hypothetical protein